MSEPFRLIALAREIRDEVNQLTLAARPRLLHHTQLQESAQSIPANIREAYGRDAGRDRKQFLRFARGSAEETDEHLLSNRSAHRLEDKQYWRLHHRLVLAIKMLNSLIEKP
jgi:four helix bundle protein